MEKVTNTHNAYAITPAGEAVQDAKDAAWKLCPYYSQSGTCPRGNRCHFLHTSGTGKGRGRGRGNRNPKD